MNINPTQPTQPTVAALTSWSRDNRWLMCPYCHTLTQARAVSDDRAVHEDCLQRALRGELAGNRPPSGGAS